MKKHLLRFFGYYLTLNLIVFFSLFSNIIIKGFLPSETESGKGIQIYRSYKCEEIGSFTDLESHFKDCNLKTFLKENFLLLGFVFFIGSPFIQPFIIISILVSYYILNILVKKFKNVNEASYFLKNLIFLFLNFILLFSAFYLFLKNN
jgi:hypothetical protein